MDPCPSRHHRCRVPPDAIPQEWVGEQQVDTVYAKKVSKPESMPTHERVLEHSDRLVRASPY